MPSSPAPFSHTRLLLLLFLALLVLPVPMAAPRPLMARCFSVQCPLFSHSDCFACVCDCPAPGADPIDLSSCGPCY
jgi:hypothetical protein